MQIIILGNNETNQTKFQSERERVREIIEIINKYLFALITVVK